MVDENIFNPVSGIGSIFFLHTYTVNIFFNDFIKEVLVTIEQT